MTFYKTIKDSIIKDNIYNFFENTKQVNWLAAAKTNKFFFHKDLKLPKNSWPHYSLIDIKPALTPTFSDYHVFMTHAPKVNGITLAHLHSFTPDKGASYLSLIPDSSIEIDSVSNAVISIIPIIIGLTRESILIGSDIYTTSHVLLDTPLRHYISVDMLPLQRHYENLYISLLDDFNKLNLQPKEIQEEYLCLENSLAQVAYKHKNMVYTSAVSVDLVYNEFVLNRYLK